MDSYFFLVDKVVIFVAVCLFIAGFGYALAETICGIFGDIDE